jgi:uncharacterized protein
MSLLFTGSQDQALLAMVIQEAHAEAARQRGFVGRTAVQKILYFLKVLHMPMGYRFEIHHYGPYCDEIVTDTEWLLADGVIVDHSDNPKKYSNYGPGEALNELLPRHQDKLEPLRECVRSVVRVLVPMRPEKLELLATLHYVYREQRASGRQGVWKPSVVARLLEVKQNKFPREEVAQTYDVMVSAGLVEP